MGKKEERDYRLKHIILPDRSGLIFINCSSVIGIFPINFDLYIP